MPYGHGVKDPSYRKRTAYHAMLLGGMATLVSAVLVMGDNATRDTIALRQAETLQASLEQVIPPELHDNQLLDDVIVLPKDASRSRPLKVYRGHRNQAITALAFEVVGHGYAGAITSLMAIDANGKILGVRVLQHSETPGLGDKIEIQRDNWIRSFDGRSLANTPLSSWAVKKDGGQFDQFTGATITPRAVVEAVQAGLEMFERERAQLLAPPAVTEEAETPSPAEETPS